MSRRRVSGYGSRKSVGFGQIRKFSLSFSKFLGKLAILHGSAKKFALLFDLEPVNGLSCKSNDFFIDIVVIKFLVIIL